MGMALLSPTLSGRPLYIDLQTQVCASSKVPRCQSSHESGITITCQPRVNRAAAAGIGRIKNHTAQRCPARRDVLSYLESVHFLSHETHGIGEHAMQSTQSRRGFLATLSSASAASLVCAQSSFAQEAPPETTTIRLAKIPGICIAPQYVAEELLRGEGFTDIRYVATESGVAASLS